MSTRARRARAGMAAIAFVVTCAVVAGTLFGIGPFSAQPARAVTDPEDILTGSLQALLDATTVHVSAELSGTLPAGLADPEADVDLDGMAVDAEVDIGGVRSRFVVQRPAGAGPPLEVLTAWDDAWYRSDGEPWASAKVSEVVDLAAVDLNPITLVDRVRAYLAEHPETRVSRSVDLPCAGGMCRVVTLQAGPEPLALLAALLPDERAAHLPDARVTLTVQAEIDTLRPVVAFLDVTAPGGDAIAKATVRFREWNQAMHIEVPSPSPTP